jgi:hypothetical protein
LRDARLAFAVHSPLGVKRLTALVLVLTAALPSVVCGQDGSLLVALAEPMAIDPRPVSRQGHFTERIEARGRLVARLLFGGRVMVLARDESVLSITEVKGACTIAVERGRVAVTVDRAHLELEDLVEVRTPHAAVTVPSGTLVVGVAGVSTFTSMGGAVEVFRLERLGGAAPEPPVVVAANETVTVEPGHLSSGVVANR